MDSRRAARTEHHIVRLCHAGLDTKAVRVAVFHRLRALVPYDAWWCTTADPATLMPTGAVTEDLPAALIPAIIANEYRADDVNKFAHLARSARCVNSLYAAAHGMPEMSARYRDILVPAGFGNEVRGVFRADGICWGLMCLHRQRHARGFAAAEIAALARIAPHVAVGLRAALVRGEIAADPRDDGPGLVLLSEGREIAACRPPPNGCSLISRTGRTATRCRRRCARWPTASRR